MIRPYLKQRLIDAIYTALDKAMMIEQRDSYRMNFERINDFLMNKEQ